jgi:hypothetical protein
VRLHLCRLRPRSRASTRKKLIEAARWWAGGYREANRHAREDAELDAELAAQGVAADTRARFLGTKQRPRLEPLAVFPENWRSVRTFRELQTQWGVATGMGGGAYLGLVYSAVWDHLRGRRVPRAAAVFAEAPIEQRA